MSAKISISILLGFILAIAACKKDDTPENPYDAIDRTVAIDNPEVDNLVPGTFAYLHAKVFRPTCANSGCHDGTFEPEFRTINGSYNSLVNQPTISNDAANSFEYRVVPGNAATSILDVRLNTFLENTSGQMPLAVDPGSDWEANAANYRQQISSWIAGGAKDMFGNAAPGVGADFPPTLDGLGAFPQGDTSNPYPRDENGVGITPILVPAAQIDIWLSVADDNTAPADIANASLNVSESLNDFSMATNYALAVSAGFSGEDFFENPTQFVHKTTIDLSGAASGQFFYLRAVLDDNVQANTTEVPNAGSNEVMKALFVLKIQ